MTAPNVTDVILSIGHIFSNFKKNDKTILQYKCQKGNGQESSRQMYSSFINSSCSLSRPICREFLQRERSSLGNERERERETRISVTKPSSLKGRDLYGGIREMPAADQNQAAERKSQIDGLIYGLLEIDLEIYRRRMISLFSPRFSQRKAPRFSSLSLPFILRVFPSFLPLSPFP